MKQLFEIDLPVSAILTGQGKGPVWCYPSEKMYADTNRPSSEELEEMKTKLLCELDKLLWKKETGAGSVFCPS